MMTYIQMTTSASVLILAIVVIRSLTIHKLPKQTFIALWAIVLCRLLIPISIPSSFSIYSLTSRIGGLAEQTATATLLDATANIVTGIQQNYTEQMPATTKILPYIIVWIVGIVVCASVFLVTHFRGRREYKTSLPIDNEFFHKWLTEHKIKRRVQIRQSDKISSPLTYGLWRPMILLPKMMEWTDESQLRYVMTHEYTHIKRFDNLKQWLLAITLCVHWFNPLVWVMYIFANRDIELSCDEKVVRTFGEKLKSSYALALISMEEKRSVVLNPACNGFSKNAIEERINAIMRIKRFSLIGIALALILVAGTIVVFATSAAPAENEIMPQDAMSTWAQYDEHGNLLICHTIDKNGKDVYLDYEPEIPRGNIKINGIETLSFFSQRINCVNGASVDHKRANGEMAVYTDNGGAWSINSGQTVTVTFNIKAVESHENGQGIAFGYLKDGIYTEYTEYDYRLQGETEIPFVAPEDGDYCFFMVNFSSDTIYVNSCTVTV
ncbi:MAG: M56 family metallopeptidase [Oscillospiraceae bacterium]|jgi:beta-lactamase regulating signal transducer with metallopeptidase domain|nr:M56 family metallopeptidase [Oscillospiraceae bacterium]